MKKMFIIHNIMIWNMKFNVLDLDLINYYNNIELIKYEKYFQIKKYFLNIYYY